MANTFFAIVIAALAACASAQLPVGYFPGTIRIVPYQQQGSSYVCLSQCSPISTAAALTWSGSSVLVNITAGCNPQGCCVASQIYTINQVAIHSRYPYYGGMLTVQSQTIPVCFVFVSGGAFVITIDGAGTCPMQTDPAACVQAGTRVVQTWSGNFFYYPTGTWSGMVTIAPYTYSGSSYSCLTQCSPITSVSHLYFSSTTLTIDIAAGRSPQGCTLNAQRYVITGVVIHANNYYGGTFSSPTQSFPVCIYFPGNGAFVITLDGKGTCPPASTTASCVPGPAGTVVQVWVGSYTRVGQEEAKLQIE